MAKELKRITYVKDDPDIRAVAEIALESVGGLTLDMCASGAEAIERVPGFKPDMILLDFMMPDMDGAETYARLRDMPGLAATPIAFMTAKSQSYEIESLKSLGAVGVIVKPFDPMTLADELRTIWARAEQGAGL